jgi:hypothetical protein
VSLVGQTMDRGSPFTGGLFLGTLIAPYFHVGSSNLVGCFIILFKIWRLLAKGDVLPKSNAGGSTRVLLVSSQM